MAIRVARKRPDSYQHGDLRRALVQAGLKLLAEGSVEGLSLRAAAELAGVSHAAPYRHFRDKDALMAAIAEEGFRLLTRAMREAIDACGSRDLLARLRASGYGYVSFAVANPAYFRVIFGGAIRCGEGDDQGRALAAAGDEAYHVLRDLVAEGIERGRLRAGDPDQLSLAAWSMVHGLAMLAIDGQLAPMGGPAAKGGAAPPTADTGAIRRLSDGLLHLLESGLRA